MADDVDLFSLFCSMDDHEHKREEYIWAPFPYPGAKSRSLDHILPHLPYRNTYIEHFGGSGVVLLSRHESKLEVFNDRYSGVTQFYRTLRDPILEAKLLERVRLCLHSREEFMFCRDTWLACDDPIERSC